jgi:hypothetical protein
MNKPRLLLTIILLCAAVGFATAYKTGATIGYIPATFHGFPTLNGCDDPEIGYLYTNLGEHTFQVYHLYWSLFSYYPVRKF